MARLLTAFLLIYSLLNAFFYSRVRVLLPEKWPSHILLILFLICMIFAPVGTRLFERSGQDLAARISGITGYSWMGFLFYSFWGFLLIGAVGILCRLLNLFAGLSLPTFTGPCAAACVLAAALAINVYGYFEARFIRVEKIVIRTAKLPPQTERLRVAQISDVHLGLLVGEERLADILRKVEAEKPDILVSTGDLVDGDTEKIGDLPAMFERIRPRLGMYAITGNHEFYAGLPE